MKINITNARIQEVIKMNKMSDTIQLLQLQKRKKRKSTCGIHM